MVGLLTLKQRSSIFLFKLVAAYIYVLLSFDVEINACVATSAALPPQILSLFNPEKSSRLSKAIKIVDDIKSERTAIGTVGSILSGLELSSNGNRFEVNSTDMGNAVGYLVAGTFFVATLVQTLSNWAASNPANALLSGLADSIVPKFFKTEEVDEDNRRSDDYTENLMASRCEKYCLNVDPKFVGNNNRIKKR